MHRCIAKIVFVAGLALTGPAAVAAEVKAFRPPAVPLVTSDPYLSVWSDADKLTDDVTRHWTHSPQSLISLIRIDGKAYRLMGVEPKDVPAFPQVSLKVTPTRSIYEFANEQVHVTFTFLTPAISNDMELISRPLTYLTWDMKSVDGKEHEISIYDSTSSELAVYRQDQKVVGSQPRIAGLSVLQIGTADQPVLQKRGDNMRIDWGYVYTAALGTPARALGDSDSSLAAFTQTGKLPISDESTAPRAVNDGHMVEAFVMDLGHVGSKGASTWLMVAYDDISSINFFGHRLRPYWRRNGAQAADLLTTAAREYPALKDRATKFDEELMADLTKVGGPKYAELCALAYRQCLAGNKLAVDEKGQPLLLPKENTSNGCIATVDVIYPMDPQFLLFSPAMAKASLATNLLYAASPRWKFDFAPHDLGTYPRATGQVYGGGEKTERDQMMVEESGNMILLCAAVAKEEGSPEFASAFWPQISQWANYLEQKGFDPENQLCTDDFAGHLAHNANLSIKAIEALGAYGMLCEMRGDHDAAKKYHDLGVELAQKWIKAADDGDHYKLAFDKPGTWSEKYNLVWDRLLDLNLFPTDVAKKEIAFYVTKVQKYGVPLDNRKPYSKTDWAVWTATLADSQSDFDRIVDPIYDFANETTDRVAFSDFYWTQTAKLAGFHSRPVIGGLFIKMMADPAMWKKWSSRDKTLAAGWAPVPPPPKLETVIPTSEKSGITWRYTTSSPPGGWYKPDFDASAWQEGSGGFGTKGTPGAVVRTTWKTDDIYARRTFTMPTAPTAELHLLVHHDDDAEIYINGVLAAQLPGYVGSYEPFAISPAAMKTLKPGENTLAVHCHQITGGQYIDVGLVNVIEQH
jgi:hypothetical protein